MKKGFTLVELIITIGLITILGAVIVANMSSTFTKEQEKQYEEFKNTLEKAACTYIELDVGKSIKNACKTSGSCSVSLSKLLTEGLIEEKDLLNPKTEESTSTSKTVGISYSGGKKTCTYNE